MTIPPELESQILRYYHAEKWRVGTIATQLNVHHSTVSRVLSQAGLPPLGAMRRASAIDPYLPVIQETLEKFPTLTASRLYVMVTERGYPGRPSQFRHLVSLHRPKRIYVCERCLANRHKSTGGISDTLRLAVHGGH